MKRRDFIAVHGAVAAWPATARAQQPENVRRVGVLMTVDENDRDGKAELSQLTQALAERGWIAGRNVRMEIRWGGGDVNRIRTFARDLVALQPDVLLTQGTPATAALQKETGT